MHNTKPLWRAILNTLHMSYTILFHLNDNVHVWQFYFYSCKHRKCMYSTAASYKNSKFHEKKENNEIIRKQMRFKHRLRWNMAVSNLQILANSTNPSISSKFVRQQKICVWNDKEVESETTKEREKSMLIMWANAKLTSFQWPR